MLGKSQMVKKHTQIWQAVRQQKRESIACVSRDYRSIIEGLQVRFLLGGSGISDNAMAYNTVGCRLFITLQFYLYRILPFYVTIWALPGYVVISIKRSGCIYFTLISF